MFKAILLASLFYSQSYATDLGKELQIATNPQDGHYQLGVHYSYDSGDMGREFLVTWRILFGTTISQQDARQLPEKLKWNVFSPQLSTYLADWKNQPKISGKDLLLGSISTDNELAMNIISSQANAILVFGDLNGNPLYNINVGKLCKSLPTYFINLTDNTKLCHQVSVTDIEIEKQKFCDNKREEFLYYIEHGVLRCEVANNRFQFLGCGQLQCKK